MMRFKVQKLGRESVKRKRGFTLAQVLVVLGLMFGLAGFSTILAGAYTRSRAAARHHDCDVHLMGVIAAIDTFRQDNHRMPYSLAELVKRKYTTPEMLRCPSDPHLAEHAQDLSYTSYGNSYVLRDVLDSDQLPIIVCPYHDEDGGSGEQAYKTFYTKRYRVRYATLSAGDWAGAVTVRRGNRVLNLPQGSDPPLVLEGGDHFSLGAGDATIRFADTSTAHMVANTELTVLQSFVQNQQSGSVYTIVHQALGTVHYYVNPGSNFDVSTPTATAGALGTRFTVIVRRVVPTRAYPYDTTTELNVTQHKVALTALGRTVMVAEGEPAITPSSPDFPGGTPAFQSKPRRPRPAPANGRSSESSADATPLPTTSPTTEPTSAPTAAPTAAPTTSPTTEPTTSPTSAPTAAPTTSPTTSPTANPTSSGGNGGGSNSGSGGSGSSGGSGNGGGSNSGSGGGSNSGGGNSGGGGKITIIIKL